ncbi:MAG: hypothetical protein AAB580_03925 [Patescibacteria group bacterium]
MLNTVLNILGGIIGGIVGWWVSWADRIAYVYILHPEAQVSQYVKFQIGQKQWRKAWEVIKTRGGEMTKLTTRSVLFQLAWVVLGFFAVTSVGSWFGKILVMAVGARILGEEWREYLKDRQLLKQRLFWQIKREISEAELKGYLIIMTVIFAWLLRMLI